MTGNNDSDTPSRAVHWNSDVVANSGPSPYLVIGPDGRVVTAVNITANGVHNPAPGDSLGAHPYVEVNDLRNTNGADVYMTSPSGTIDGGSCVGGANNDACKRDRRGDPLLGDLHLQEQLVPGDDPQPVVARARHRRH